jgi:hypothetical protein
LQHGGRLRRFKEVIGDIPFGVVKKAGEVIGYFVEQPGIIKVIAKATPKPA